MNLQPFTEAQIQHSHKPSLARKMNTQSSQGFWECIKHPSTTWAIALQCQTSVQVSCLVCSYIILPGRSCSPIMWERLLIPGGHLKLWGQHLPQLFDGLVVAVFPDLEPLGELSLPQTAALRHQSQLQVGGGEGSNSQMLRTSTTCTKCCLESKTLFLYWTNPTAIVYNITLLLCTYMVNVLYTVRVLHSTLQCVVRKYRSLCK